jgi:hypothetical protein
MEQFYCHNCQRVVLLNRHGYCEHCGSDALIPAAIIEISRELSNPIPKPQSKGATRDSGSQQEGE